jgi:hypothetical protein
MRQAGGGGGKVTLSTLNMHSQLLSQRRLEQVLTADSRLPFPSSATLVPFRRGSVEIRRIREQKRYPVISVSITELTPLIYE